ncbi:MAG: pyridoxal phosphate-dependent aminotransferase [Oscillospiraceae bacterium]|jgi:cystathionine beta-lyase|nr:pyridoxal phosphate-dependent aminotransferase [Oscillospiraceae bacterium]
MPYDFDTAVNRKRTNSVKHDFAEQYGLGYNCIPLWIADMDFRTVPEVCRALQKRVEHGVFGYSQPGGGYFTAVGQWLASRHNWRVEPRWLALTEGVLPAVSTAIAVLTKPGDSVLIQTPSYNQFNMVIEKSRRKVVKNPLVLEGEAYRVDFDDFERQIERNGVKAFVLCSPHNPVGRVWTEDELVSMGEICMRHGVKVISDEIFADLVYPGHRHTVFASLSREFLDNTVTCMSPTKTFNLSGAPLSNIFIADDDTRYDFEEEHKARGNLGVSALPAVAAQAAYEHGAPWLDELMEYLGGNVAHARDFVKGRLPDVGWTEPEGTYLLWLDFRRAGFWARELEAFIADEAKILLSSEPGAEGFLRLNLASPRSVIEKALRQLEGALERAPSRRADLSPIE